MWQKRYLTPFLLSHPLAALYACGAGVDSAKALWAEATSG